MQECDVGMKLCTRRPLFCRRMFIKCDLFLKNYLQFCVDNIFVLAFAANIKDNLINWRY